MSLENTRFGGESTYFNHVQTPIINECRPGFKRVLEIGCGAGATLALLKGLGAQYVVGLELSAEAARRASTRPEINKVIVADIGVANIHDMFGEEKFDLIIASFVLEHVIDPWAVVNKMKSLLSSGGQLVGALPNVRHVGISVPLLLTGRWKYTEDGILDWTHAKFFTKQTIRDLFVGQGFRVDSIRPWIGAPSRSATLNRLTFGAFRDLLCFAYTFSMSSDGQAAAG